MKTKLALIALAAIGGLAFANSASAHPDIRVGIHFGSPAPVYRPAAPVVVVDHNDRDNRYDRNDRGNRNDGYGRDNRYDRPSGYWKEIVVKTWVPATYVMVRDWHGRSVRRVEPGHFAYRTERVWVSHRG